MNAKDLIQEYNNPKSGLADLWDKLTTNPDFRKILLLARLKMGKFNPNLSESVYPHIQAERSGGFKAWSKLESVLLTTVSSSKPFNDNKEDESEFVDHISAL